MVSSSSQGSTEEVTKPRQYEPNESRLMDMGLVEANAIFLNKVVSVGPAGEGWVTFPNIGLDNKFYLPEDRTGYGLEDRDDVTFSLSVNDRRVSYHAYFTPSAEENRGIVSEAEGYVIGKSIVGILRENNFHIAFGEKDIKHPAQFISHEILESRYDSESNTYEEPEQFLVRASEEFETAIVGVVKARTLYRDFIQQREESLKEEVAQFAAQYLQSEEK